MRMLTLEHSMGAVLGHDLTIASADPTFAFTPLSRSEWARLNEFTHERRKKDWLRGRNALKQVLASLGRDTDTSSIEFPHRQLSLTHAGDTAFSVADISRTVGVGIDYEPLRNVNPKMRHWFVNEAEEEWLDQWPESGMADQVVRLWTMKEAAYKSHPDNAGLVLADFTIEEPRARTSDVTLENDSYRIRVASELHAAGYLSIAICGEAGG